MLHNASGIPMPLVLPPATDPADAALLRDGIERSMARVPAMMHAIDADGRLTFVSDAWLDKLGYARDEVLGRASTDFLTAESRDYARSVVLPEFFRTGRCDDVHYQLVCRDGGVIDVLLNGVLQTDAAGRKSSIAVLTDISAMKKAERRVAESEARYRLLAENSTDMVTLLARDGARLYVSPACEAITGFTAEEIIAKPPGSTIHPDDVARVLAVLADPTGQSPVTYRLACKDGGWVWVETSMKPVTIDGRSDLLVGIVRNVEDRVRAEQHLQESEARYRFITENTADLIILVDSTGKRSYVSPACEALVGYTQHEMLGMNSRETIHPDDLQLVMSTLTASSLEAYSSPINYRMRHKDGRDIWVETSGRLVDIPGQRGLRLVIVRDIGQRRHAEQQLKDSEARYRLLAENSSDMVFQLDLTLVRRYVSPACRELLGYEPEELIGIKPLGMAHPDDAPFLKMAFEILLGGAAEQQSIINRIRHRDGRWIWVEARLRALRDSTTGEVVGIIGALRDISSRKQIEDELADANRRLQALAAQDSLTTLANRRTFDEALMREHLRARREQAPLSLIMIDVDHFKRFNDTYGHPAGDECLRRVASAIAQSIARPADLAARYGGEEFAVLLPNTDEDGAAQIAERIASAVVGLCIAHDASANGLVTVSAGVGTIDSTRHDADRLVAEADRALYRAKDFGRNVVLRASEVLGGAPHAAVA